jgi:uncharacterized cupin superfamily protein
MVWQISASLSAPPREEETMKKIAIDAIRSRKGARYPSPFDQPCRERLRRALGDAAGLEQFGVNLLELPAGAWSSQRHWHSKEDEFVWVLEGQVVLITDQGEEVFRAGDCVGFRAGDANGHHFQNRSEHTARLLEIGSRHDDDVTDYPDIDLRIDGPVTTHKDGRPY